MLISIVGRRQMAGRGGGGFDGGKGGGGLGCLTSSCLKINT